MKASQWHWEAVRRHCLDALTTVDRAYSPERAVVVKARILAKLDQAEAELNVHRCLRCFAILSDPESIAQGMGRCCASKQGAA